MDHNLAKLRDLDIDDMICMALLAEGKGGGQIAKELKLTPPAICHRLLKFQNIFGKDMFVFAKAGHRTGLSEKGKAISLKFTEALTSLADSLDKAG